MAKWHPRKKNTVYSFPSSEPTVDYASFLSPSPVGSDDDSFHSGYVYGGPLIFPYRFFPFSVNTFNVVNRYANQSYIYTVLGTWSLYILALIGNSGTAIQIEKYLCGTRINICPLFYAMQLQINVRYIQIWGGGGFSYNFYKNKGESEN